MAWLFQCNKQNRGIARLNFDEAALLWRTVKETSGPILEIGRYQAGSTALLCAASAGREVVSIDLDPCHDPAADEFLRRPEIREHVELLTGDSRVPLVGREFGMLFIDGDHSYEGVTADISAHWPAAVAMNGRPPLVAFHDATARISEPAPLPESLHSEELCARVSALRNMLIDALGQGNFDSAIHSMLANPSSGNIASNRLVLEFDQLPQLQKEAADSDCSNDRDITGACHRLLKSGAAQHHRRAGSMLVLEKRTELPPGIWE
ncbi:MAG: hypothetical protein Tsb009_39360 [Planctomycetaceae bacterium]